jgi:hypothetical protein
MSEAPVDRRSDSFGLGEFFQKFSLKRKKSIASEQKQSERIDEDVSISRLEV